MPKYHVTCHVTRERIIEIEAGSEAEARAEADRYSSWRHHEVVHDGPDFDWTVWEVEEV